MSVRAERAVEQVRTENEAREVITNLLLQFGSNTALDRVVAQSRFARQTVEELARRTATNVLRNFVVRRPGGYVNDPYAW